MIRISTFLYSLIYLVASMSCETSKDENKAKLSFQVSYPEEFGTGSFDGRMLLLISNNNEKEPRFQINDDNSTQMVFGMDVNDLKAGEKAVFNSEIYGYPLASFDGIPDGEYYVQAVLHKYDTFKLANGHTVLLPMDQGEGQHWNTSPKNLYSTPVAVKIAKSSASPIEIVLNNEIPAIEPVADSEYIKHIRIQSDLLTKFWGRPMYLQANVLIPHGFDKESDTEYPLMVFQGHFPETFGGFSPEAPTSAEDDGVYNSRFGITGYQYIVEKEAHDLYKAWTSENFPRFLAIEIQHQNPYYDDSYAVNSANIGPYGDAITYELIPHVEKLFNGAGEGWSRFTYGGSTGGWEALAVQVFYPDEYNGCFASCPDPIDFRAFTQMNIYEDENAYYTIGDYRNVPRPGRRNNKGALHSTLEQMNQRELVLGTNSRSGDQYDIWEAVYSPVGENGYPKRIWDKKTGAIDKEVAAYWRENYDLRYIMARDWDKIGAKLEGKINIYCGDMDNYYLNNAVMLAEEFLENTKNPYYAGEVKYGDMAEHCWNGDPDNPNYLTRLRYNTMYLPQIKERLKKTAPKGHKLKNWGI
jgi:hypothetical protein